MKKLSRILPVFAAAVMLLAFGCANADITDGLVYDETDNTWAAVDKELAELAGIMKRECTKSPLIDTGYGNGFRRFQGKLPENGIRPEDIRYIFLTIPCAWKTVPDRCPEKVSAVTG